MPQNINLPLKLGDTGSNFEGSFDGGWKTFQGSSIPENTGKIQLEMGEKLGAQFLGFQITDNCHAQMNRKDARS